MTKRSLPFLDSRSILFVLWFSTLFLSIAACTKQSRNESHPNERPSAPSLTQSQSQRININTASAQELEALPGIGKALAERIIEHREKYGTFRKPEHLIIVRGISDNRFRNLRDLITVE